MVLILRTWPEYAKDLRRASTRWRLEKDPKSPYIYVRDQENRKRVSCKPYRTDNAIDVDTVFNACLLAANKNWSGVVTNNEISTKSRIQGVLRYVDRVQRKADHDEGVEGTRSRILRVIISGKSGSNGSSSPTPSTKHYGFSAVQLKAIQH